MPEHKTRHRIFVMARHSILIHAWQWVSPRSTRVECLVLVQEVVLGDEARVDIAIAEGQGEMALLVNVWEFSASARAVGVVEN